MSDTAYAPWMDDADPPDDLTDAELEKMLNGVAWLLKASEYKNWDESEHPRDEAGKFTDAGGGDGDLLDTTTGKEEESTTVESDAKLYGSRLPDTVYRGEKIGLTGPRISEHGTYVSTDPLIAASYGAVTEYKIIKQPKLLDLRNLKSEEVRNFIGEFSSEKLQSEKDYEESAWNIFESADGINRITELGYDGYRFATDAFLIGNFADYASLNASVVGQINQDKGDIADAINKLPEINIRGSSFNENGEAARQDGEAFAAHIENGFMRIATEHPSLIINARVAGIGVYREPEEYDNGYPGLGTVACFDRGNWRISVFQRAFDNFGTDIADTRQGRQREVLIHEVCHAYDFQKTISVTDTFKKAMSDDFDELHNLQKEMDDVKKLTGMYGIISRVTRNERELFAEVGSRILWPKAAARDEFFKLFPRTTQVIMNSFKKDGLV